jgi:hypothetical protein
MAVDAPSAAQRGPAVLEMKKDHAVRPDRRNAGALDVLGFLRSVRHRAAHAQIGDVSFAPDDPSRRLTASILLSYNYDDLLALALEQIGTGPGPAGSLRSGIGTDDERDIPPSVQSAPGIELDADNIINLVCSLIVSDEVLAPAVNDVEVLLTTVRGAGLAPARDVRLSDRAAALLQSMRIEQDARDAVLREGVADADQVGQWLGGSGTAIRDKASKARRAGKLLGLDVNGRTKYPIFQIDPAQARIRPGVAEANTQLNAKADPWGVASWWLSPSGWLPDGQRPADVAIAGDRELLQRLVDAVGNVD